MCRLYKLMVLFTSGLTSSTSLCWWPQSIVQFIYLFIYLCVFEAFLWTQTGLELVILCLCLSSGRIRVYTTMLSAKHFFKLHFYEFCNEHVCAGDCLSCILIYAPSDICLRVIWLGQYVSLFLVFDVPPILISMEVALVTFPPTGPSCGISLVPQWPINV
jgi:hypothetical protein